MAGFTYKSYSFVDKDPMIDQVRTIIQDSGKTYKHIAEDSGVNTGTIRKWLDGATKKPQAASLNAVLRSLGWKLSLRPLSVEEVVRFTPAQPKLTTARHVVQMSKYRKRKKA
jgi:predicted transcriptional regulator